MNDHTASSSFRKRSTTPKPFVFVLMPFADSFNDIYRLGIKSACENAGAYCERVNEQFFKESILRQVYNQIAKADLIVADMTGRNPNVFYEVGYAHALDKDVVLLTQSAEDIPFDLKHHFHIIYGQSIVDLLDKLTPRVRWSLFQLEATGEIPEIPSLQFYIDGKELADDCELTVYIPSPGEEGIARIEIVLHNPGIQTLDLEAERLAVIVPACTKVRYAQPVRLPDGRLHCELAAAGRLFPSDWKPVSLSVVLERLSVDASDEESDDPYSFLAFPREIHLPVELRHYQEHGVRAINARLTLLTERPNLPLAADVAGRRR